MDSQSEKECEVKVEWSWIDDGCAKIYCPKCGEELIVNNDLPSECCGRKFLLHQKNWITEIKE